MGATLEVPIFAPLPISIVVEAVQRALIQLLNWPEPLPVQVTRAQSWIGGETAPETPTVFDAKEGVPAQEDPPEVETCVWLRVEGVGGTNIICMVWWGDEGALTTLLYPEGKGHLVGGLVLCVACAIALSRLSEKKVEGDLAILGTYGYGEDFLEALRCRETHTTIEGAVQEVLDTISRRRKADNPQLWGRGT